MTDSLNLEPIKARAAAATPGPWEVDKEFGQVCNPLTSQFISTDSHNDGNPDARFIAHARADVPALVAEVERLRAERDKALVMLDQRGVWTGADDLVYDRLVPVFAELDAAVLKAESLERGALGATHILNEELEGAHALLDRVGVPRGFPEGDDNEGLNYALQYRINIMGEVATYEIVKLRAELERADSLIAAMTPAGLAATTRAAAFAEAKEIYRSLHSGGCRMLSLGDACNCFLCQCDAAQQKDVPGA